MKSYLLGLYEKSMPDSFSLQQKLEETGKAGYDYMELSVDESDGKLARLDWTALEIASLKEDMLQTGIPIKSICLSAHRRFPFGDPDLDNRVKSLEIMYKAVELSAALGVRIIQLAGYDVYYKDSDEESVRQFSAGLTQAVDYAAREGIILAFETMETPFMDTVSKAMHWVDFIHSPYLQIYPDLGNLTNAAKVYSGDVLSDLKSGSGHLAAMHLKETCPGVYREMVYGSGHVDFISGIKTAWDLGIRMFVGEFWHLGESDVAGVLRQNMTFLREKIKEIHQC